MHENDDLVMYNNQPSPVKKPNEFLKVFKNQFKMFLYSNNIDPKAIKFDESVEPSATEAKPAEEAAFGSSENGALKEEKVVEEPDNL